MGYAIYTVSQTSRGWIVRHDGEASQPYETVGAAFEAACHAVSSKLEQGLDATVTIDHARRADDEFGRPANGATYTRLKGEPIPWG
jgi:hypothetical protein